MAVRKIYRNPVETARHRQMKRLCLDYFTHYDKLLKHPSFLNASRARKACVELKRVAHARGIELLELYSPTRNGDLTYNQKKEMERCQKVQEEDQQAGCLEEDLQGKTKRKNLEEEDNAQRRQ